MNYQVMPEDDVVIQRLRRRRISPVYRFPSVSLFMPFDPKMEMKNKLRFSLSKLVNKAVSELKDQYPGEMSQLVIQKLKAIIKNLDFNTYKKSIAIFVSPVFEKVYYLNIDLEEKVIVAESFQMRDLLNHKKQSHKFHILLLSEKGSRIFLSDTNSFIKITNQKPLPERYIQNDSKYIPDAKAEKGTMFKNFIENVDHSLEGVLKHERLPFFVMGDESLIEQFKILSENNTSVIEYVPGDFEKCSSENLKKYLKSYLTDWQKINQKSLMIQLKESEDKDRLSLGLENVLPEAGKRKGLLLIEKEYLIDERKIVVLYDKIDGRYNRFSCIKNPVDDVIEKVLINGGDVELVSNGLLNRYSQIAMIKI